MKKSIFVLTFEEIKKVDIKLRGSGYFKLYTLCYAISLITLFLVGVALCFAVSIGELLAEDYYLILLICFCILFTLLYFFKRFELIKQYYEEEKNEK